MAGEPADTETAIGDDGDATAVDRAETGFDPKAAIGVLAPLVLLAIIVVGMVMFPPFAGVETGEPLPDVAVTHATMPDQGSIVLHVTNNGPEPQQIEQVLVDDAYWAFTVGDGSDGARMLAPLESTHVHVPYHWNPGWDLEVAMILSDGTTIHHEIEAPMLTPGVTGELLWTLALVGLFVGVIPVLLGMAWFPFMRGLSDRWLHAILALAGGVLAFLAFDAGFEALEVAEGVPSAYEGALLVILGVVGTLLVVQAVAEYFRADGTLPPLSLAYLVALSIGLHNLAEGLAIGGAVALGHVSLGAFLVIGFMVHNVTEGPAIVAPVARDERPALVHFAALGLLAGAPVILGGWIGSLALSPTLGALFLAIGVGAILQVLWEMGSMIRARGRLATVSNLLGFLIGLVVMYATDLLVAL